MKSQKFIFAAVIIFLISVSCTKYEDGPILTFRSKKERIAGTWKYESIIYVDQGTIVTTGLPTLVFKCAKDGLYSDNKDSLGTWEFSGEVDLIINKSKGTSIVETTKWEILKLANKQLWLRKNKIEHHFIPG
ncbi:MAG: hypothetical protein COX07_05050 [Bacteroidetes bacterium CG23_combo_of_CG06-09_8_20_14_all_32_9]|nr:MAG: hypothetical protein COX07_05050 [Bacteroidetes bacterium CG23_combo_of_CG06-09_8_20_14_all_32_9]